MDFEIRKDRKPQGRKKLTRERAEYFQLMQQGYSSREACRRVERPRTAANENVDETAGTVSGTTRAG